MSTRIVCARVGCDRIRVTILGIKNKHVLPKHMLFHGPVRFVFNVPISYAFSDHYLSIWTPVEQPCTSNYPEHPIDLQKTAKTDAFLDIPHV